MKYQQILLVRGLLSAELISNSLLQYAQELYRLFLSCTTFNFTDLICILNPIEFVSLFARFNLRFTTLRKEKLEFALRR